MRSTHPEKLLVFQELAELTELTELAELTELEELTELKELAELEELLLLLDFSRSTHLEILLVFEELTVTELGELVFTTREELKFPMSDILSWCLQRQSTLKSSKIS